jgi:hypothetical protein
MALPHCDELVPWSTHATSTLRRRLILFDADGKLVPPTAAFELIITHRHQALEVLTHAHDLMKPPTK